MSACLNDDCISELVALRIETVNLQELNREMLEVISFYADKENWCYGESWNSGRDIQKFRTLKSNNDLEKKNKRYKNTENIDDFDVMPDAVEMLGEYYKYEVGGKRARQFLAKYEDEIGKEAQQD